MLKIKSDEDTGNSHYDVFFTLHAFIEFLSLFACFSTLSNQICTFKDVIDHQSYKCFPVLKMKMLSSATQKHQCQESGQLFRGEGGGGGLIMPYVYVGKSAAYPLILDFRTVKENIFPSD